MRETAKGGDVLGVGRWRGTATRARRLLAAVTAAIAVVLALGASGAQALPSYTVTGLITNPEGTGVGLAGTQIDFIESATHQLAGVATAEMDGGFAISLPEGAYEVIVAPLLGSKYPQYTINSFVVNEPRTLNVELVPQRPNLVTWTGVLRGAGGTGLAGYTIRSRSPHIKGEQEATTSATGAFSIELGEEVEDELTITGYRPAGVAPEVAPSYVSFNAHVSMAEGPREQDLQLPLHDLAVTVTGPHGPVSGAQISYEASYASTSSSGTLGGGSELVGLRAVEYATATNTQGLARIATPATVPSVSVNVTPPSGSGLEQASFDVSITNRSGELHHEVQLQKGPQPVPIVSWSGVLRGVGDYPLAGYQIRSYSPRVGVNWATTNAEGRFSIGLGEEAGDELVVEGSRPGGAPASAVPFTVGYRWRVSMSHGERQQDIVLPLHDLTLDVTSAREPVEGATVGYETRYYPSGSSSTLGSETEPMEVSASERDAVTGAGGSVVIALPAEAPTIAVNVTPPEGSRLEPEGIGVTDLVKEETREVKLREQPVVPLVKWEGQLLGADGEPLPGYTIRSRSPYLEERSTTSHAKGLFEIELGEEAGDELVIEGDRPGSALPGEAPETLTAAARVSMAAGPRDEDLKLPFHVLSVKVGSAEGAVVGAEVSYYAHYFGEYSTAMGPATELLWVDASGQGTTGRGGMIQLAFPAKAPSVPIGIVPPAALRLEPGEFTVAGLAADEEREITLSPGQQPPTIVTWTGDLLDSNGKPLSGYTLRASSPGLSESSVITGSGGSFELEFAQEVNDTLTVEGSRPAGLSTAEVPSFVHFVSAVDMSGGMRSDENLTLPLHGVKVTTAGHEGDPIEGVQLRYSSSWEGSEGTLGGGTRLEQVSASERTATTNSHGEAILAFPRVPAKIEVFVSPPAETELGEAVFYVEPTSTEQTVAFAKSQLDTTPPEVNCSEPPTGWQDANVSIQCTASDSESGLLDPSQASFTLSTEVLAGQFSENAKTRMARVCDRADNCVEIPPFGPFKIDREPPQIEIAVPEEGEVLEVGKTVLASYKCSDKGSGLLAGSCTGTIEGGQPLPTGTAGERTLTVFAQDVAGNTASAEVHYTVKGPPRVTSSAVLEPARTSASLEGTVDPQDEAITLCQFEYREAGASAWTEVRCPQETGGGIGPIPASAKLTGLTPAKTYEFRLTAQNKFGTESTVPRQFTTAPPAPPTVVTGTPAPIKRASATLVATVNPNEGKVEHCEFEYGTTREYGDTVPCDKIPGSGATPVEVSAPVTALTPGTVYHFRIVAQNAGIPTLAEGADQTFTTLPEVAPSAETLPATEIEYRVATLHGRVEPNEVPDSECYFEYGTALLFPAQAPCKPQPGSAPTAVEARVSTLSANTTYTFRLVAANTAGTGVGQELTFATKQRPEVELGRCIKLAGAPVGGYSDGSCSTPTSGGRYEWQAWPVQNGHFRFKNGAAVFETARQVAMRCSNNTLYGEYTSPHSADVRIVFAGCEARSGLSGKCQSEGAQAGEIEVAPIAAELVLVEAANKVTAGWDFRPVSGSTVMTFHCGAAQVTVKGAVIAPLTRTRSGPAIGTMSPSFKLKFEGRQGKQKPEEIEKGAPETLTLDDAGAAEPASLTLSSLMVNEELLEIRKNG